MPSHMYGLDIARRQLDHSSSQAQNTSYTDNSMVVMLAIIAMGIFFLYFIGVRFKK